MVHGIDPEVDFDFKKVYGGEASSRLLPSLIDAVRRRVSSHRVTAVEVLNPYTDKVKLDEKLSILDIKARDEAGQWFHLEIHIIELPEALDTTEIHMAMEVLEKMAQNTLEREIYEGRLKAERDRPMMQEALEEAQGSLEELQGSVEEWKQKY